MNQASFLALWCFVFVLPLDVLTSLSVVGSIPRLVGLVASVVGIVHILARGSFRPLTWFHLFAVLFVLWAGVSTWWSIDPEATRTKFLTYLQLLILVWLVWEIAWSPERQRALLQAYVLGACIAAVAVAHNSLSGAGWLSYGTIETERFAALGHNPNELGLYLALGIPMAWYLSLALPAQRLASMWRLYVPLAGTAILLTASRGAFLTAIVALVIIPWTQARLRTRAKVALYALLIGTLVVAIELVPETSLERIASTRADIEAGDFGGRGTIWSAGLEVAREHPLIGVGAGGFVTAVAPTLLSELSAHQVLLSILVETGAVGLFLFLAMVGATLTPLRNLPPTQRRFSIVLLFALMVGSLSIDWDNRKPFWFILGLLAAQIGPSTLNALSARRRLRGERRGPGVRPLNTAAGSEESAQRR